MGAALGCTATFASQGYGGRAGDLGETLIGCGAGAVGSLYRGASTFLGFAIGLAVSVAQPVATYVSQSWPHAAVDPASPTLGPVSIPAAQSRLKQRIGGPLEFG